MWTNEFRSTVVIRFQICIFDILNTAEQQKVLPQD